MVIARYLVGMLAIACAIAYLVPRTSLLGAVLLTGYLGGAVATGSGLTGLRHRVEALDGTLEVRSPLGVGTTVRAELPCE